MAATKEKQSLKAKGGTGDWLFAAAVVKQAAPVDVGVLLSGNELMIQQYSCFFLKEGFLPSRKGLIRGNNEL